MAAGAAAALPASGIVMSARGKEGMLPWQAFHAMAYMVRESNMVKGPYQWHALPPLSADRWDHSAYVELCCHFHQQAALEAVCGATPAAQLLADNVLLSAWRAAASTLRLCSEVMQCTVLQDCAPRVQVSRQHTALSMSASDDDYCRAMQWLNSEQTRSRLATDAAAHVAVCGGRGPNKPEIPATSSSMM